MKKLTLLCIGLCLLLSTNASASVALNPGESWSGIFQSVYDSSNLIERLDFFEPGQADPAWQLQNNGSNAIGFFLQKWLWFQPGETMVLDLDSNGSWQMQDGGNVYGGSFTDLSFSGTSSLTISLDSLKQVSGNMLPDSGRAAASAVPLPGAAWLLGSGVLGLYCLRRKD